MNENQVIVLEDLNVQGMMRNKHLSKYISDIGWSEFGRMVEYKTQWHEKVLEWKAPHFSSQRCSECGDTHKDNRKSQSLFVCQRCGYKPQYVTIPSATRWDEYGWFHQKQHLRYRRLRSG